MGGPQCRRCKPPNQAKLTESRQKLQVQSHLEMPGILDQLGHIQHTKKLAPQIVLKWSPTWILRRYQSICPLMHATDITYAKFHARTARTTVPK